MDQISDYEPHTLDQAFRATRLPRVLLAEDDDEMRELLERTLSREGYHVLSVATGDALLVAIEARQIYQATPELIISDVRMPGHTGLEVLVRLRRHDWLTPVILITAFGDPETHHEAERLGAAILDKPFDLDELRDLSRDLRRLRYAR